jgi:hypothetical protein
MFLILLKLLINNLVGNYGLGLLTPEITKPHSTVEVTQKPILMTTPPFSYYISDNTVRKEGQSIKLITKSYRPNEITDEDNWFISNNLTMNTYEVPNSYGETGGNLPIGIYAKWNGLIITKAIYDDTYIYCIYGKDYSEGYILNIYDFVTLKIVYSFDFSNYSYAPDYSDIDYDFIQQRIDWATIKNNILYISNSHSTYAESSNDKNAYITAIDLEDMDILWRTGALVSNSQNFLIIDNVIICGYGFTDERDYLYLIDIYSGKVLENIPLKTQASYILKKDNVLFVRTYP